MDTPETDAVAPTMFPMKAHPSSPEAAVLPTLLNPFSEKCAIRPLGLDHLVLTVRDLDATVTFYTTLLGMTVRIADGRHELVFGTQKINLHTRPGEFQPAANHPTPGSADICLEVAGPIEAVLLQVSAHTTVELGPVARQGARGCMTSIYLRDPDGNLIELCVYPSRVQKIS